MSRAVALDATFATALIYLRYLNSLKNTGVKLETMHEFFYYAGVATTSFAFGSTVVLGAIGLVVAAGTVAATPLAAVGALAFAVGATLWGEKQ